MNKTNFLYIVIAILMLLNVITIAFMWCYRPFGPKPGFAPPPNPVNFVLRELGLDEHQQKTFAVLRGEYAGRMMENRNAVGQYRNQLHGLLAKNDAKQAAILAEKIGTLEKENELLTFEHFQKVRALCNDKQKEKFDRIIQQVLQMVRPGFPPGPPRERKR